MEKNIDFIILIGLLFLINSCSSSDYNAAEMDSSSTNQKEVLETDTLRNKTQKPLITFVELGSVKCIPCKKMQPVMRAIEEKYGDQIKVIFYDVWTEEGRPYAQVYNIRLIPTQVFLDQEGAELLRHEGFFPEKEIDKFLQNQGLKPIEQVKHD